MTTDPKTLTTAFRKAIGKGKHYFKIGRCQAADFDTLANRPAYKDPEAIEIIYRGTAEVVEKLEKDLIAVAKVVYAGRCMNIKDGGGGLGDALEHIVYVVRWPNTGKGRRQARRQAMLSMLQGE